MGVCLEQWRCRIGGFFQPGPKWAWKAPCIALASAMPRVLIKVLLLYMVCVGNVHGRVTDLYSSPGISIGDVGLSFRLRELRCEISAQHRSEIWGAAIHSTITRACAGDIELNPGPGPEETSAQASEKRVTRQATLAASGLGELQVTRHAKEKKEKEVGLTLDDIMKELRSMNVKIDKRFDEVNDTLNKKVNKLSEDIGSLKRAQVKLKKELGVSRAENQALQRRLDKLEGQSRRNNVIVRGIPERNGRETWEDCEAAVRKSLSEQLQFAEERARDLCIERAHRLPRVKNQAPRTPRNIIVKLAFYKDKTSIMESARRIKPEGVYYMDDFCDSVKTARAKLKGLLAKARESMTAYLSFNKLVVMNEQNRRNVYVYDERSDTIKLQAGSFCDGLLDKDADDADNGDGGKSGGPSGVVLPSGEELEDGQDDVAYEDAEGEPSINADD